MEYNLKRMKKAAELLITSDINISEAGYQKSPSQYRKSAGKPDTEENTGEENE